jgi:hypothetical protein
MNDERRYQVFVSSTSSDLLEERQKVLQAVLESKAFPSGMEMFPSADDEQWEFIKREILSSDYYVVVVAGKYGSLATDGISFTEKEYDYAVEKSKPVMGFLAKDLQELKGAKLESEDFLREKLEAFRNKVKAGRLVRFYSNPDELRAQVLQALNHSYNFKPQDGWVRGRNARRIEDLEEIAILQKKVINLEGELSAIRAERIDPRDEFLIKNSEQAFTVELRSREKSSNRIEDFEFKTSWEKIFLACFRDSFPRAAEYTIKTLLSEFILLQARANLGAVAVRQLCVESSDLDTFCDEVQKTLVALDFIDIRTVTSQIGHFSDWVATERGRLLYLRLACQQRESDSSASEENNGA